MNKKILTGSIGALIIGASIVGAILLTTDNKTCGITIKDVRIVTDGENSYLTKEAIIKYAEEIEKRQISNKEKVQLKCEFEKVLYEKDGKKYSSLRVTEKGCVDVTVADYRNIRNDTLTKIKSGEFTLEDYEDFVEIFNYESVNKCGKTFK